MGFASRIGRNRGCLYVDVDSKLCCLEGFELKLMFKLTGLSYTPWSKMSA